MSNENLTLNEIFDLAIKNHQNNNLQDARNYYQKVLELDPNHSQTLNNLGAIFLVLGERLKAKNCYEKVIELNPNYADAHNNLGNILKELGERLKAKECYEKAITINPNYLNAHYNLGTIFRELGERLKAKNCYEKVIELNPNYADAHNSLGVILKELGEIEKAKECYEKAIEIDPDLFSASSNFANIYISQLTDFETAICKSNETLKIYHKNYKFINQSIALFKLKHDIEQANYLNSKNYKINGIDEFIKTADEILGREENKEDINNYSKRILLNNDEILGFEPKSHMRRNR